MSPQNASRVPPPGRAAETARSAAATSPRSGGHTAARRTVIQLDKVTKVYPMGDSEVRALNQVDLTITEGEMVAIMGPSGSGKSTMMGILGCLDAPTDGLYLLDGIDVAQRDDKALSVIRNTKIGFVFQSFCLIPRVSAIRNVELPLIYSGTKDRARLAAEAMEQVGLGNRHKHLPTELSGGQQQRVAIARALVTDPAILLADEPTGNLDSASSEEIMRLLISLNEQGRTVVIITHEENIAAYAHRVIRLRDGVIVSDSATERPHAPNPSVPNPAAAVNPPRLPDPPTPPNREVPVDADPRAPVPVPTSEQPREPDPDDFPTEQIDTSDFPTEQFYPTRS
jgi:putative ABC transport system ATP-binding protein